MRTLPCFLVAGLLTLAGCPAEQSQGPGPRTGPAQGGPSEDSSALTPEQMEEIQKAARAGQPGVERCYTEELEKRGDKSFKGKLTVKILIGTNGTATQVTIVESELKAPAVHQCIEQAVKGWEFPTLRSPSWFSYPYTFQPAY
ncbi:MAG: AgmX/PglI C-terminal domain-containing protein [Deltaproteobacteria bacterium]|nr:AgmX/PglI C-terminal domain-containing protein [Deltaproteobacteria bacterium]